MTMLQANAGNSKVKKFNIGGFNCITVSFSTVAAHYRRRVPFLENKRDTYMHNSEFPQQATSTLYRIDKYRVLIMCGKWGKAGPG
jgi:hypothetical protein